MDNAQARIDASPLPGMRELRRRSNLAQQFIRFLSLNWTMYRLAKHHD